MTIDDVLRYSDVDRVGDFDVGVFALHQSHAAASVLIHRGIIGEKWLEWHIVGLSNSSALKVWGVCTARSDALSRATEVPSGSILRTESVTGVAGIAAPNFSAVS